MVTCFHKEWLIRWNHGHRHIISQIWFRHQYIIVNSTHYHFNPSTKTSPSSSILNHLPSTPLPSSFPHPTAKYPLLFPVMSRHWAGFFPNLHARTPWYRFLHWPKPTILRNAHLPYACEVGGLLFIGSLGSVCAALVKESIAVGPDLLFLKGSPCPFG